MNSQRRKAILRAARNIQQRFLRMSYSDPDTVANMSLEEVNAALEEMEITPEMVTDLRQRILKEVNERGISVTTESGRDSWLNQWQQEIADLLSRFLSSSSTQTQMMAAEGEPVFSGKAADQKTHLDVFFDGTDYQILITAEDLRLKNKTLNLDFLAVPATAQGDFRSVGKTKDRLFCQLALSRQQLMTIQGELRLRVANG